MPASVRPTTTVVVRFCGLEAEGAWGLVNSWAGSSLIMTGFEAGEVSSVYDGGTVVEVVVGESSEFAAEGLSSSCSSS